MYISAHLMYVPCNLTMELSSTLDTVTSTDQGTFIKVAHLLMEKLCSHTYIATYVITFLALYSMPAKYKVMLLPLPQQR